MRYIKCLEDKKEYGYTDSKTPYEAISGLLYTLNCNKLDKNAVINKTDSGRHLWFEHSGKTYCIKNGI